MLRIGIIGTGSISAAHIRSYLAFPETCRVVALCDSVAGKAAHAAEEHGLAGVASYQDVDEMLAAGDLDLVTVATPPSTHAAITVAALESGVHVLVEKPMAPSLEECDAMLAAQRASGRLLSVVAQNRFRDDLSTLKEVVGSGLLGSLSHVRIDSAWWRGLPYYDLWWRGTWESEGGGPTLNHAIHHIDLLLWLLGRPEEVVAVLTNAQHHNAEVEDLSVAVLRYGRALATLTSSVVHHGEEQAIVVHGEHARVSQPWKAVASVTQPNGFGVPGGDRALVERLDRLAASHVPLVHTGHTGQIADVLAAVRDGHAPAVSGSDGRDAVEVVTAIYESGIERRFVPLPLASDDPYYRAGGLVPRAPHFFEKLTSVGELQGEIVVGASPDEDE